jgi:hypothetical protein
MLNLQLLVESKQIINNNLVLKCSQNIESPERTQIKFDAESDKPVCLFVTKETYNSIKYGINNYNVANKDVYIYEYTTGNLITKLLKNRVTNQFGTVVPSTSGTSPFLGDIIFPNLNNFEEETEYYISIDSYLAPVMVQIEQHKQQVIEQDMKRLFEKIDNLSNKENITFFISNKTLELFNKYSIKFNYRVFTHDSIIDFMLEKLLGKTVFGPKSNMIGALEFKGYTPLYITSKTTDTQFNMRTSSIQFSGCGLSEFIVILEKNSQVSDDSLNIIETISNKQFHISNETIPNFEIQYIEQYIEIIKLIEIFYNYKNNNKNQEMKEYIKTNIVQIINIVYNTGLSNSVNKDEEWYIKHLENKYNKNIDDITKMFLNTISRKNHSNYYCDLEHFNDTPCITERLSSCAYNEIE